jgi:hypothetical protein
MQRAIAAVRRVGRSAGAGAGRVIGQQAAGVMPVAMSASLSCTAWCWQSGLPNVVRCCE